MQDTDSGTSSAAPASQASAKGGKPAPQGAPDRSLDLLKAATGVVTDGKPETVAKGVKDDLDKLLMSLLPKSAHTAPDEGGNSHNPKIAPFRYAHKLALQQADLTFDGSKEAATAALRTALGAWRMALSTYDLAIAQADSVLQQAVTTAVSAYEAAFNRDSHSREWYLYYTMKVAIVSALQTYHGSAASAADALATAAGALISAHQSYMDAIGAAQCQRLVEDATADQSFWQQVETALDAV